ncbi:UNVERIFIED_CONTAM: hypothetical protein GTU68_013061 [Idotea baltica]|nr:hypothetical protein [Idotea baltica]
MPETIFSKIISKEIDADIVHETDSIIAFRDISPQAKVHILIIPKKPITGIASLELEDQGVVGEMLLAAKEIAINENLDNGYRLVINQGEEGGQTVDHLHLHLLGGRSFSWPPG